MQQTNSQYLKWFHSIEKALWSFFNLFGNICTQCTERTMQEVTQRKRDKRELWTCCMIDNQVHDNWESLNTVQTRFNKNWESILRPRKEREVKMPGNGPCPALGEKGCLLKKCRPITCTTQLCSKMLFVLKKLNIINKPTSSALQIEDLITLPNILPALYGTGKKQKVTQEEANTYISEIKKMKKKLEATQPALLQKIITEAASNH